MTWFPDRESVAKWGGPPFRYPFDKDQFLEDVHWEKMPTYVLFGPNGTMLAFGQTYEKAGRGHLARLIVSAEQRGRGYGASLVTLLSDESMELFSCAESSLYVLPDNTVAMSCYAKVGFGAALYPEGDTYYPTQKLKVRTRS